MHQPGSAHAAFAQAHIRGLTRGSDDTGKVEKIGLEKAIANNIRWLKNQIKEGKKIIDIGRDVERTGRPGPFYQAEKSFLEKLGF